VTSVSEVHAFRWPSPDDYDYSTIAPGLAQNNRYRLVRGGGYEPFLLCCYLRGMEQAYEDLLVNPDIADAILGHIFEFHYELNRRTWEAGRGQIDLMYLAEDLGGQTGPLFGLETYRRFLLPNQKKMADLARSFGLKVFYHTDGAARVFLPDLIDVVGIDVLNPIQWRCPGMERESLARDFGKRVIFHSAIDNQQTLPFGTPDDVRREVRECAEIFRDCRWVCGPCHNIQAVSPVENIVAMYETAHAVG
jgi:uroporphyrinogen decarboxylase